MKKEINLSEISQKLNLSKSTISKALNNKGGVSGKTKQDIIDCARKLGYFYTHTDKANVNILIPARFKKYCTKIQNLFKKKNIVAKCGIYSTCEDYVSCLEALKKSDCNILILYPLNDVGMHILKNIEKKCAVWFVYNLINLENTFYFGNNPKNTGVALANEFIGLNSKRPVFVLYETELTAKISTASFYDTLVLHKIFPVSVVNLTSKTMISDALIARTLKNINDFDSIYCSAQLSGFIDGAIKKLGKQNVCVFTYNETEHLMSALEAAAENAERYLLYGDFPICKYNLI